MGRWVRALAGTELRAGEGRPVLVDGRWVALFRGRDGSVHAIDDTCPHQGASLGEGLFHEGRVICPWHNWVFDVATGACVRVPGLFVACYATRSVGGDVEIELPDEPARGDPDAGPTSA